MACKFSLKAFDELTNVELYYILQAREQVFIIESQQFSKDIDEVDFDAQHLIAHKAQTVVGYGRIIPPTLEEGVKPPKRLNIDNLNAHPRIDKVLVLPEHRGYGIANHIMTESIKYCRKQFAKQIILLNTKVHLREFYESLGFVPIRESQHIDGSMQLTMALSPTKKVKMTSNRYKSVLSTLLGIIVIILGLCFIAGIIYLMQ